MPIANCIVRKDCVLVDSDLVQNWSKASGITQKDMTVNIIESVLQSGCGYKIMANLYLPSMWSDSEVSALQVALSKTLAHCFRVPVEQVHVMTEIIKSGMAVEAGESVSW